MAGDFPSVGSTELCNSHFSKQQKGSRSEDSDMGFASAEAGGTLFTSHTYNLGVISKANNLTTVSVLIGAPSEMCFSLFWVPSVLGPPSSHLKSLSEASGD